MRLRDSRINTAKLKIQMIKTHKHAAYGVFICVTLLNVSMFYNNYIKYFQIGITGMISENEYKSILLNIGIKIGYYRRKAGMTQAELAEYTGMTLSYISQLESPNLPYCPSIKALFSIAKVLGVSASKLIDIDD